MTTIEIGNWISSTTSRLIGKTEFPAIEVAAIVSHFLGISREKLVSHPEVILDKHQLRKLDDAVKRLLSGEPLAYILGHWSFYGFDLLVSPDVLIPRPETEILVNEAIRWLRANPNKNRIVDVGTGSGAIALSVGKNVPDCLISAIDISEKALVIAQTNIQNLEMASIVTIVNNDLLSGIAEKFDLILANLPYIPEDEVEDLIVSIHEPQLALDGGKNGLRLIGQLLDQAPNNLLPGGCIFLEIQYNQARDVQQKGLNAFLGAHITVIEDLARHPRVVRIQT